ncbi:hypothetical protein D4S03_10160 [bacterium]|nr:MAG: hypothetical protein D4S03_10160 [bacterium]
MTTRARSIVATEESEQAALVTWLEIRGVLFTATAGGGIRDWKTAKMIKRTGYKRGICDIIIFDPPGGGKYARKAMDRIGRPRVDENGIGGNSSQGMRGGDPKINNFNLQQGEETRVGSSKTREPNPTRTGWSTNETASVGEDNPTQAKDRSRGVHGLDWSKGRQGLWTNTNSPNAVIGPQNSDGDLPEERASSVGKSSAQMRQANLRIRESPVYRDTKRQHDGRNDQGKDEEMLGSQRSKNYRRSKSSIETNRPADSLYTGKQEKPLCFGEGVGGFSTKHKQHSSPQNMETRYVGTAIEMKRTSGGRVSPEQKWWMDQLRLRGWCAMVCYGAGNAIEELEKLGY